MVDPTAQTSRIETRADMGKGDAGEFAYWQAQEKIAEREERHWVKQGRQVVKRYRDERGGASGQGAGGNDTHRFNILWSNVQTLLPTLYARTPKPDVQRRFKDDAPIARLASTLLERSIAYSLSSDTFDAVLKAVVEDRLLPGRGVARVLYVPHYGEELESDTDAKDTDAKDALGDNLEYEETEDAPSVVDSDSDEAVSSTVGDGSPARVAPAIPLREVIYEEVRPKYIFWEDYREGPARSWEEVPWVRYRAYMTKDELKDRFGASKANKINLDYSPKGASGTGTERSKDEPPPDLYKKAVVHEYWDKVKLRVVWLAPGTPDLILDEVDDPLQLPDFYPNPDPLLATTTNDKRIPVPDYVEYQDQARELDSLTARIDRLQRALKVSGIYPGENKQVLQQLIDEGTENRLIPVEDWPQWTDKGGLKEFIQWMPIEQVANTLIQLYNARDRAKQILYEITGIGDILRGQTDPTETKGAQELKAVFSTRRIQPKQKDVAQFARALIRLMASIICEHFSAKTISMITGYPMLAQVPALPPMPPPTLPAVQPPVAPGMTLPSPGPAPQSAPQPTPGGPIGIPGQAPPSSLAPQPTAAAPSNVVPFAQPSQPSAMPPTPPPKPNPAFAQWQQQYQQINQIKASNAQLQQQFDAAVALMKEDGIHGFKLDIEADSTIAPDENAEKQARTEFLAAFIPLMEQVVPMAQGNPALAALGKEVVLFGVRAFSVARPLEDAIEKAFDAIAQMPPNPEAMGGKGKGAAASKPGPDPRIEQAKIAADVHDTNTKAQLQQQDIAARSQAQHAQLAFEAAKTEDDMQLERRRLALEAAGAADESSFRRERALSEDARAARGLA